MRAFKQIGSFQSQPLREFTGLREDFDEFVFRLKAYLNLVDSNYAIHLTSLQDCTDEITDDYFQDEFGDLRDDIVQMSKQLHWFLVSLCSGSALTFLQCENTMNGFESFRKLCQKYRFPVRTKSVGRLTKILTPNFNMSTFEDSLSSWEDEISKYEKDT